MDAVSKTKDLLDHEINNGMANPVASGIFHLMSGLFHPEPGMEFRAASLKSQNTWKSTLMYMGNKGEDFNLNPQHCTFLAEDVSRQMLHVRYVVDGDTVSEQTHSFFEYEKLVKEVAYFLVKGREMSAIESFAHEEVMNLRLDNVYELHAVTH